MLQIAHQSNRLANAMQLVIDIPLRKLVVIKKAQF
jgi:hypothetical protein